MRIAVLGSGALGCLFAARLAAHADVWMLGTWADGIAAVQQKGIRVHEAGLVWQARLPAISDPTAMPPADIALVLVKSYQTERAARWAAQALSPRGLAVTLQNGLDNAPRLALAVGAERTVIGVTFEGVTLLGPGEARHAGQGLTALGTSPVTASGVDACVELLQRAGFAAHAEAAIDTMVWEKAIANAAINPLTALWRIPNGDLLATAERRDLLTALTSEAAAVAGARGIAISAAEAIDRVEAVCRATAANHSSMLQDVERGRPTEIDSINGVIVAEGRRLAVPTPLHEMVWRIVSGSVRRKT